ncbi:hypothetical protein PTKIN_Ptkin15bG0117300 [Pterospermum kingtungense]
MENVVKRTHTVVEIDPDTNTEIIRQEKVWNYTIADITLLAFGTSFPQISLATIDAIQNMGNLYAGGLGPGTLVGSAAFDLFPIHAVCVVVPKAGELKKISAIRCLAGGALLVLLGSCLAVHNFGGMDTKGGYALGGLIDSPDVWTTAYSCICSRWTTRSERPRPEDWVPAEVASVEHEGDAYEGYSEILPVEDDEHKEIVDIFSFHSENQEGTTLI